MIITWKYLSVTRIDLIHWNRPQPVKVTRLIQRHFTITTLNDDQHRIDLKITHRFIQQYGINEVGQVSGEAGAHVHGVTRGSTELAQKAVDIAIALNDFLIKKFQEVASYYNLNPELYVNDLPDHFSLCIAMQNEGVKQLVYRKKSDLFG